MLRISSFLLAVLLLVGACTQPKVQPPKGWPQQEAITQEGQPLAYAPLYQDIHRLVQAGQGPQALTLIEQELAKNPEQPNLWLTKAKLMEELGHTQQALNELTDLIQNRPNFPGALAVRGQFLWELGNVESAQEDLEKVLETPYRSFELHKTLAQLYASLSKVSQASQEAKRALKFAPQDEDTLLLKAKMDLQLKRFGAAMESLEELIRIHPENHQYQQFHIQLLAYTGQLENLERRLVEMNQKAPEESWYAMQLSSFYLQKQNTAQAKVVLEKALLQHPNNHYLQFTLARLYQIEGHEEEALDHYKKGLLAKPDATYALVEVARIQINREEVEEAIQNLKKARDNGATESYVYEFLARILNQEGDTWEAERVIVDGLRINPDSVSLLVEYGSILEKRGHFYDAIEAYQEALTLRPDNYYILGKLGNLYRQVQNYPKAEEFLLKGIQVKPDSAQIRAYLSEYYFESNKYEEAISTLREMLLNDPSDYFAYFRISVIEDRRKRPAQSLEAVNQALALDPSQVWLNEIKGQALMRLQRFEEAEIAFEKALSGNPTSPILLTKLAFIQARIRPEQAKRTLALALNSDELDLATLELNYHLQGLSPQIWGFAPQSTEHKALTALLNSFGEDQVLLGQLTKSPHYPFLKYLADYLEHGRNATLEVKTQPKGWHAFYLGYIKVLNSQFAEAVPPLERANQDLPGNEWIQAKLAMAYEFEKEHQKAISLLEQFLTNHPDSMWAKMRLALNYDFVGNAMASERVYLDIIKERPNEHIALNNLAWLYATTKDPALQNKLDQALELSKKAVSISPNSANLDTLAEILFIRKDYEGAIKFIERALDQDRSNQDYFKKQKKKFQKALERSKE